MNRKDTILVAVLINAGVLVVLFTSALKNKQVEHTLKEPVTSAVVEQKFEPVSIMKDEIELAIEEAKKQQQAPVEHAAVQELTFDTQAQEKAPQQEAPQLIQTTSSIIDVTVKKGDFLAKIAKRHGVSVEEIMKTNNLKNTNLRIGQVLKIPQMSKPSISAQVPSNHVPDASASFKYYTIKAGDNPWTIAHKHKMKVEELLKLNQLTAEKAKSLKVGDKLKVKE